jgi:hypothetical protein
VSLLSSFSKAMSGRGADAGTLDPARVEVRTDSAFRCRTMPPKCSDRNTGCSRHPPAGYISVLEVTTVPFCGCVTGERSRRTTASREQKDAVLRILLARSRYMIERERRVRFR